MFPIKRTKRMLTTMSRVIAFPGTWKRLSTPSCLIVIPSREMPKSARPPSAVAVFIVIRKLATRQKTSASLTNSESVPRIVIIPPT